jgi:pantetheine-phosphate adenylyltransferase
MKIAVYPGTFDPITNGHIDILKRASTIFDLVYIGVAKNIGKDPLFSANERLDLIRKSTEEVSNVEVRQFDGLVVEFAKEVGASVIIRGLRAISDFDYEFQMALMNRYLDNDIDTVFLMPGEEYTYLSSSTVREIARFRGNISAFVPDVVREALEKKFRR